MEQNNFEKNVQQKMDELKIPPSDLVWANVEKKIGKKEKGKRGIILFFIFFLLLLLGGYWFMKQGKNDSKSNQSLENVFKKDSKSTNNNDSSSHPLVTNEPSKTGSTNKLISKSNLTSLAKESFPKKKRIHSKPTNNDDSSSDQNLTNIPVEKSFNNELTKAKTVKPQQETISENKIKADQQNTNPDVEVATNQPGNPEFNKDEVVKEPTKKITPMIAQKNTGSDSAITKVAAQNKVASTSINDSSSKEKSLTANKKHPWIPGITLSGGTSWINKSSSSVNNLAYSTSGSGAGSSQGSSGGTYYSAPSSFKSSVAFVAKFFLEKNISSKNKISIGFSYKYFSIVNKVGSKIDSFNSMQYASVNVFSSTNNIHSFRNNFHFVEVPVSIKFQLNKNKNLPISWNAGINISELVSSNALQFDSNSHIYYPDNNLFNKLQFGFHTGFSVTVFATRKYPLTFGPSFYYGLTKLSDKGLYNNQHFNFIGINAGILFRKK